MQLSAIRLGLFAFLLFGLLTAGTSAAQAQGFGITAGANFDSLGDIDATDGQATLDRATGFHVGIFYDLAAGPVAIRPGLTYVDVGSIQVENATVSEFDVSLFEVPVDLRFRMGTPVLSPYVLAGPVIRFADADDGDFDEMINNLSVAGAAGGGIELVLPGVGITVAPEVRYQFGVTRFIDDFEVAGATVATESDLNTFMVRLNVSF